MDDYAGMSQRQLVDVCRSRGLPVYGTKAALLERLGAGALEQVASAAAVSATPPTPDPPPVGWRGSFRVEFPEPEPPDGPRHEELRLSARRLAEAAGRHPIGGLYSARLVSYRTGAAMYEVPVR